MTESDKSTTGASRVALKPRAKPNPLFAIEDVASVPPHETAKTQFERAEQDQRDRERYRAILAGESAPTVVTTLSDVTSVASKEHEPDRSVEARRARTSRLSEAPDKKARPERASEKDGPMVHQGFRIPESWRRELRIFALNRGVTVQELFEQWVKATLGK